MWKDELKLTVDCLKTHLAHSPEGVALLGVVIHTCCTRIQEQKLRGLKAAVQIDPDGKLA